MAGYIEREEMLTQIENKINSLEASVLTTARIAAQRWTKRKDGRKGRCGVVNRCKDCFYHKDFKHCKDRRGSHQYCFTAKKQTNFDRIRAMSVEKMAELLSVACDGDLIVDICDSSYCDECSEECVKCSGNCKKAILKWLESEVEGE